VDSRQTVCVRGLAAQAVALGKDGGGAWEQRKLEARKMLEKPHCTPAPSAYCLGWHVEGLYFYFL
jgi:hypothetical protein